MCLDDLYPLHYMTPQTLPGSTPPLFFEGRFVASSFFLTPQVSFVLPICFFGCVAFHWSIVDLLGLQS